MVQITQSDLQFLFEQVTFDPADLEGFTDKRGIRQVDGYNNNLVPGQEHFGAVDLDFIRLASGSQPADYNNYDMTAPSPFGPGGPSNGFVVIDPTPRMISNVIASQSGPIENVAALPGVLPFNGWMTLFGQFFDHGLDFIGKGEQGFVMVPLDSSDPLYDPTPGAANFMIVSRANVSNLAEAGPDQIFGTTDDVGYSNNGTPGDPSDDIFAAPRQVNHTSPFVDQNQTYGSHVSIRTVLMAYDVIGGVAVANGKLLEGANGGLATWADVKANAAKIGLTLTDQDIGNAPLLRTNADGSVFRDANGHVEVVTDGLGNVVRSGHAFLLDVNPAADPTNPDYDPDLLNTFFIVGDGRINENYGLTAVHAVFHAEHNQVVDQIQALLNAPGQTISLTGEQLFEAAKLVTEMEYQHIVFDEFVRRITPNLIEFSGEPYDTTINAAISAEFAQAVYRLGHSMLTETIDTIDPGTGTANSASLISAFLNPAGFVAAGGAGAIALGMSMQVGNEIDEFVTDALRNNLLGLPLDLAAINITRGRDVGLPTLNELRAQLFAVEGNPDLAPYTSWADFGTHMKTPGASAGGSLLNFITAYGFGTLALTDINAARAQAAAAMNTAGFLLGTLSQAHPLYEASQAFNNIDLWIGGLAEEKVAGGLLGSTFDAVFANQMNRLQFGDRFYYLERLSETNLVQEIEAENFSDLIMRNTDATYMHTDSFGAADARILLTVNADASGAGRATFGLSEIVAGLAGNDNIQGGAGSDALYGDEGNDTLNGGEGDDFLTGGADNDTLTDASGSNLMRGNEGDDVLTGGSGKDFLHGGPGNDNLNGGGEKDELFGGLGDDIAHGNGSDDKVAGGEGNDTLYGDDGIDELLGDQDNDTLFGGAGQDVVDGGDGDDILNAGSGGTAANREIVDGDKGFDFASYEGAPGAVTADLINFLTANAGDAAFDSYIFVEGLIGSSFGDILFGDNDANELRGGDGNDRLIGRGANDVIDGGAGNADVAEFSDDFANYDITFNPDGSITIVHARGAQSDGTDTLRNVELLRFRDIEVPASGAVASPATGAPTISDQTPTEGLPVTAGTAGIADPNGLGPFSYQWQSSSNGSTWSNIAGATNAVFSPDDNAGISFGDQAGLMLRVVVSFTDGIGTPEQVTSAATGPVGVNWFGNSAANTLNGTAGDDLAGGAGGADTLNGNAGDDDLEGGGGNDTITGGAGDDEMIGGGGAGDVAVFAGPAGNYSFSAPSGNVITVTDDVGNEGVDTLSGFEILRFAGVNHNVVAGGGGANTLNGGAGSQAMFGFAGNDTINGAGGSDIIVGGNGNDRLTGGSGNDHLVGDAGVDTHVFTTANFGNDRILDFTAGQDRIEIDNAIAPNFAVGILGNATQNGGDVLIAFSANESITLVNFTVANLQAGDFLFV